MSEPEHYQDVRIRVRYAQEDLRAAETMLCSPEAVPRHICFLAQQSAEKAIKGALIFPLVEFPYIHDLERLRNLLPAEWRTRLDQIDLRGLTSLSQWAVESRYPGEGEEPDTERARVAASTARQVLESMIAELSAAGMRRGP
ncbi:MAG: HEPN domain-containing protein [Candidatus Sumerlaeota bacterium]|nr:HEPN domain-containing protein [Candidatus Sumerlaeota bacterium]